MRGRLAYLGAILSISTILLAACTPLPREAKQAILRTFDPDEQPRIHSARRVDPLLEDLEMGAEEVWCVNVVHRCWSCAHREWRACISSYLVRRVDGKWEPVPMLTEEDWEGWEARGCPREPEVVGEAPRPRGDIGVAAVGR